MLSNYTSIDELIEELEKDPEIKQSLEEARIWVREVYIPEITRQQDAK